MSDALKPCPFCGGEASKIHASGLFERVYCKDCFAQTGGLHSDRAMAKKAWNTRTPDTSIEALTAERDDHWKSFVHWRKEADNLTEQLEQLVAINEAARADAKEAEAYAEELEAKLTKTEEDAARWLQAFSAQSRKLQAVLHIDGVKEALAELKGARNE